MGELITEVGAERHADAAALLVSELVTNVIMHANTDMIVAITASASGVRIAVTDQSPHLPAERDYGTGATTGRGLEMVRLLADGFGTEELPSNGKTVWFELGNADGAGPPPVEPAAETAPVPSSFTSTLVDLPIALFAAWQQHADALLREYFLASWEAVPDGPDEFADHGAAVDAFGTLTTAVAPLLEEESAAAHRDVLLELTGDGARCFAELGRALDHAVAMSESGLLLVPPPQPEIQLLRRWLCAEVARQAEGEQPRRWPGVTGGVLDATMPAVEWNPADVLASAEALVAADDTNQILAVSPSVTVLLGWTSEDLVGRRLVTVIPERLREQHIASFTLHLLTGRRTILEQAVTVPALHRDGHEVLVELLVHREPSIDGRHVFVATMQKA